MDIISFNITIMLILNLISFSFLITSVYPATLPLPSQGSINLQTEPVLPSELLPARNISTVNASSDNVLQIQCNADLFGENLKVPSCRQVLALIMRDTEQITFAKRGTTVPYDIPLPYRLQSSQSPDNSEPEINQKF
jgi:hypothetical protein